MANNETIPEREETMVAKAEAATALLETFVHGDENTHVDTEGGAVPSIAMQAKTTKESVMSALENVAAQMAGAMIYKDTAAGLLGTIDGAFFSVPSANDQEYLILYQNNNGVAEERARYPSAAAAMNALIMARVAFGMSISESIDPEMPWGVFGKGFKPILGVNANGTVHAILDKMPGLDGLGDWAFSMRGKNDVVLFGIRYDGYVHIHGALSTIPLAFLDGPVGGKDVFVLVGGEPYQVTSTGDNFSVMSTSDVVNYISREGGISQKSAPFPMPGSVASFVKNLVHVLGYGQSLSMGDTSTVVTKQPPAANRLLTIQDGVRLTDQEMVLTNDMVVPFKPMVSKDSEVPVVQLSAQLNRTRSLRGDVGLLTSAHGRNGRAIASLSKGTKYYQNLLTAVASAKAEATRLGLGYRVPFVDWIQGEADSRMTLQQYLVPLLQLQSDLDADIRAIKGDDEPVRLLLDQVSNFTNYNLETGYVPLAQLQAALDYPERVVCAGPKYWVPTNTDGTHLTGDSYTRIGAMHARAANALINGGTWLPTHAVAAVRSGTTVIVRFHTPQGPLQADTINVKDPGNWGVRYFDDSDSAEVVRVRLIGENCLEVTLNQVPTGQSQMIGIADAGLAGQHGGPDTGARSCLRDSSPDLDAYGRPLFNWACHQQISIRTAA